MQPSKFGVGASIGVVVVLAIGWQLRPTNSEIRVHSGGSGENIERQENRSIEERDRSLSESLGGEGLSPARRSSWWEDPQVFEEFLEAYHRHVPKASMDAAELRSSPMEVRERLNEELEQAVSLMSEQLYFSYVDSSDFSGWAYDSLLQGTSWLRIHVSEYQGWLQRSGNLEDVPPFDLLVREAEYYPIEFLVMRMRGETKLDLRPDQVVQISSARNALLREVALLESHIWELRPAAKRAARELGLSTESVDWVRLVPDLAQISELKANERSRYVARLELLLAEE